MGNTEDKRKNKEKSEKCIHDNSFDKKIKVWTITISLVVCFVSGGTSFGVAYITSHASHVVVSEKDQRMIEILTNELERAWKGLHKIEDDRAKELILLRRILPLKMEIWKILYKYDPSIPSPMDEYKNANYGGPHFDYAHGFISIIISIITHILFQIIFLLILIIFLVFIATRIFVRMTFVEQTRSSNFGIGALYSLSACVLLFYEYVLVTKYLNILAYAPIAEYLKVI